MKTMWFIDIIEKATREKVKTIGSFESEQLAEFAERGVLRIINTDEFFTSVRSVP